MARRWCLVEQDEQLDLFVEDSRHVHLVDINLRLDVPRADASRFAHAVPGLCKVG